MGSFFLTILTLSSLMFIFSSGSTLPKLTKNVKGGRPVPPVSCSGTSGNYPHPTDCNYFITCDGHGTGREMECAYCWSPFDPDCCSGQLCYDATTDSCEYCTDEVCDACYGGGKRNVTALH